MLYVVCGVTESGGKGLAIMWCLVLICGFVLVSIAYYSTEKLVRSYIRIYVHHTAHLSKKSYTSVLYMCMYSTVEPPDTIGAD